MKEKRLYVFFYFSMQNMENYLDFQRSGRNNYPIYFPRKTANMRDITWLLAYSNRAGLMKDLSLYLLIHKFSLVIQFLLNGFIIIVKYSNILIGIFESWIKCVMMAFKDSTKVNVSWLFTCISYCLNEIF